MTKVIWVFIIAAVVFIGYRFYVHWEQTQAESGGPKESPVTSVSGESLPGLPPQLETSLRTAKDRSPAAFRAWFKLHEKELADPRKAWIELDLCVAIRRDDPAEARQIYAHLKQRVPPSSPVWPRMKELERAFQ
jgi:hypothetical protein